MGTPGGYLHGFWSSPITYFKRRMEMNISLPFAKEKTRKSYIHFFCDRMRIGSIYDIFAYIWLIFMGNVGKYTIHGSYIGMGPHASEPHSTNVGKEVIAKYGTSDCRSIFLGGTGGGGFFLCFRPLSFFCFSVWM